MKFTNGFYKNIISDFNVNLTFWNYAFMCKYMNSIIYIIMDSSGHIFGKQAAQQLNYKLLFTILKNGREIF